MVEIRLDIDEGQNKIINMCKLVNSLESKQNAISKIIMDWGKLQSISDREIEKKIIESWKQDYRKASSGDWIKRDEEKLKKCYDEYKVGLRAAIKKISKYFKIPIEKAEKILNTEEYEEGEDKFKDKVFDRFQDEIGELQSILEKKYDCEILHEEGFFETRTSILELKSVYTGGKEVSYYLDNFAGDTIKKVIKILRGSKSLRDIMDENKFYLEKMEKQASEENACCVCKEEAECRIGKWNHLVCDKHAEEYKKDNKEVKQIVDKF